MAPRRGGEGGAGASPALPGGRGTFEPPPLKRMQPWLQDGSGQCDLLAGGVDEKGVFNGVYLSGVQLMALLRTFQLSQAFLPVDTSTPVAALGQSLQDGIPIIIVTRGCFGRDMDIGAGPVRNDVQKSVWEICRQMRSEMSQVLITCIDLPINCGSDLVQACLSDPLNEYRELMFHEGSWYAPTVVNSASLAKWKAENKVEKDGAWEMKANKVKFNRKKFGWNDDTVFFKNAWTLSWKPVLEVRPAVAAPRRTDLDFVTREQLMVKSIQDSSPSGAQATMQKALSKARESADAEALLNGAKAYLNRAKPSERQGLDEAAKACLEASQLYKNNGEQTEALGAVQIAVSAYILANEMDQAMHVAKEATNTAANPVKAAGLIMDVHTAEGNLDQALAVANQAKEDAKEKKDAEAVLEATGLIVATELSLASYDAALAAAQALTGSKNKKAQSKGFALLGEVYAAKAAAFEDDEMRQEAVTAYEKAKDLYKDAGLKEQEARALQGAISALLSGIDGPGPSKALALAKELQGFEGTKELLAYGGAGAVFAATAHIQEFSRNGNLLEGGREAMLAAALQGVSLYDQAGDAVRKAGAQRVLLEARRTARPM